MIKDHKLLADQLHSAVRILNNIKEISPAFHFQYAITNNLNIKISTRIRQYNMDYIIFVNEYNYSVTMYAISAVTSIHKFKCLMFFNKESNDISAIVADVYNDIADKISRLFSQENKEFMTLPASYNEYELIDQIISPFILPTSDRGIIKYRIYTVDNGIGH